jgi:outer membrane protein assembly factor BamD
MRKSIQVLFILSLTILATSCNRHFRKVEKNPDWRVKYEAALKYYEKKEYYKASVLFDQIMPIVRGLPEGEKVQFYLAYCQYYDGLFILAAEQFRTFYTTYGRSSYVEEARFMYAYSLNGNSPDSNLDQSSSIEAMNAMQIFINRYPTSKFRDQAFEIIETTQVKLEKKGFENAKQYHRMKSYKAAIVALDNFRKNFPDSKYQEEAYALQIESQYQLAVQSFSNKQRERFQDVVETNKEFIDKFPNSKFLRDTEKLYAETVVKLQELNS